MKAIVWTKYGSPDGLQLREVEKPTFGDNDLLIRVDATTVTAGDTEVRSLKFPLWLALPIRLYMGVIRLRNKILGPLAGSKNATHTWRCTRFLVLTNQWRNETIKRRDLNRIYELTWRITPPRKVSTVSTIHVKKGKQSCVLVN